MDSVNVDDGVAFGTWDDPTSKLMYCDVMPLLLSGVNTTGVVVDLGGGNGLLKKWIPQAISVDTDQAKNPDVLENALTHTGTYDLVVMRYLLHYLDDLQVVALMNHLALYHDGQILLIQFVNEDTRVKYVNSAHEKKYFRTEWELNKLLTPWKTVNRVAVEYVVRGEFYENRLGLSGCSDHPETIVAYTMEII